MNATSASFDFQEISRKVKDVLHQEYPGAAISTVEGWHGRVHVKMVSPEFDGRSEEEKQNMVWDVLHARLAQESQAVSLALVYGMDEI